MQQKTFLEEAWEQVERVRKLAPLVQNITNLVVMNSSANVLLALGASPLMSHAREELGDIASIANALVINIGTLDNHWVESMKEGVRLAQEKGLPVVLDPVGSGASAFRTQTAKSILSQMKNGILRGNASEILSLVENASASQGPKGVDSLHESTACAQVAKSLLQKVEVVVISGKTDVVLTQDGMHHFRNGHSIMRKVTGMGCAYASVLGAFAAVEKNLGKAALAATAYFGVSGECAGNLVEGPGHFEAALRNTLYSMNRDLFFKMLKWEAHPL